MKIKTIISSTAALFLALSAACGGNTPENTRSPAIQESPTAMTAPVTTEAARAAETTGQNTLKQTIEAQTNSATGTTNPTQDNPETKRIPPSVPSVTETDPEITSPRESPSAKLPIDGEPRSIDDLLPDDPRTDEQILLQDIYAQIDLEQFALDPTQTLSRDWALEREDRYESTIAYIETRDHPYLHLFPILRDKANADSTFIDRGPRDTIIDTQKNIIIIDSENFGTRHGIDHFMVYPWFEAEQGTKSPGKIIWEGEKATGPYWFGNKSPRGVLSDTVAKILEQNRRPGTIWQEAPWTDLYGDGIELRKWRMDQYIRTTIMPDGYHPRRTGISTLYKTPKVQWEILHPKLPIMKITTYVETSFPLLYASQDPGDEYENTLYAVSFVIAFQNRWTFFNDPNRIYFRSERKLYTPDPNQWGPNDYMQHSIIGPVVVQVYESEVIEPGIYSAIPKITHWEAPGPILTDEQMWDDMYDTLTSGETVKRGPHTRLPLGLARKLTPSPNWPLPGDILANEFTGPGTKAWEHFDMDERDW